MSESQSSVEQMLLSKQAELQAVLSQLEHELRQVNLALEAISDERPAATSQNRLRNYLSHDDGRTRAHFQKSPEVTDHRNLTNYLASLSQRGPTIKTMIYAVLRDLGRATHDRISEQIRKDFGTTVVRTSLSPQLSRLKSDGVIDRNSDGEWLIDPRSTARLETVDGVLQLITEED